MEKIDFAPLKVLLGQISDNQLRADIAKAVARIEIKVNELESKPIEVMCTDPVITRHGPTPRGS